LIWTIDVWLLDTNVISEVRKARPHPALLAWLDGQPRGTIFLSAATIGEIQRGVETSRRNDPEKAAEIEAWLNEIIATSAVLPADERVFRRWAKLMNRRSSDLIVDALIAATAEVHHLTVATRNVRDFEALGVAVVNPFEG
jgi:predicted nucleic acid-binding protein